MPWKRLLGSVTIGGAVGAAVAALAVFVFQLADVWPCLLVGAAGGFLGALAGWVNEQRL